MFTDFCVFALENYDRARFGVSTDGPAKLKLLDWWNKCPEQDKSFYRTKAEQINSSFTDLGPSRSHSSTPMPSARKRKMNKTNAPVSPKLRKVEEDVDNDVEMIEVEQLEIFPEGTPNHHEILHSKVVSIVEEMLSSSASRCNLDSGKKDTPIINKALMENQEKLKIEEVIKKMVEKSLLQELKLHFEESDQKMDKKLDGQQVQMDQRFENLQENIMQWVLEYLKSATEQMRANAEEKTKEP